MSPSPTSGVVEEVSTVVSPSPTSGVVEEVSTVVQVAIEQDNACSDTN
jgi:hypothetical protein